MFNFTAVQYITSWVKTCENVTYYTLVAFIYLYFIFTKHTKTHQFYPTAKT